MHPISSIYTHTLQKSEIILTQVFVFKQHIDIHPKTKITGKYIPSISFHSINLPLGVERSNTPAPHVALESPPPDTEMSMSGFFPSMDPVHRLRGEDPEDLKKMIVGGNDDEHMIERKQHDRDYGDDEHDESSWSWWCWWWNLIYISSLWNLYVKYSEIMSVNLVHATSSMKTHLGGAHWQMWNRSAWLLSGKTALGKVTPCMNDIQRNTYYRTMAIPKCWRTLRIYRFSIACKANHVTVTNDGLNIDLPYPQFMIHTTPTTKTVR